MTSAGPGASRARWASSESLQPELSIPIPPFQSLPPQPKRSESERLSGASRPDLAAKALQTVLASTPAADISAREVQQVLEEYGLTPAEQTSVARRLWRMALIAFLADDVLTDEEVSYLFALRGALDIGEADAMALEAELMSPIYERVLNNVLADGQVTADERHHLERIATDLRIGKDVAARMHKAEAQKVFRSILESVLADRLLTDEEKNLVEQTATDLGITLDDTTRVRLDRSFLRWFLSSNTELPALQVPITLQRNEICHLYCIVAWNEMRKESVSGTSFEILKTIDVGTVYITNKRIFFDGEEKNVSFKYDDVIKFTAMLDAIKIEKGSGKAVYLVPADEELADLLALALKRRLEANSGKFGVEAASPFTR